MPFMYLWSYVVDSRLYCVRVPQSVLTFFPCRKTDGLSEVQTELISLSPSSDYHRQHCCTGGALLLRTLKDVVVPYCTRVREFSTDAGEG